MGHKLEENRCKGAPHMQKHHKKMMQFIARPEILKFVAKHGASEAEELIASFCRAETTAETLYDAMCDVLPARDGFRVDLVENPPSADYARMNVMKAGAPVVHVVFSLRDVVKQSQAGCFEEEFERLGTHCVLVGRDIIGRRALDVMTLPGTGKLVAFLSKNHTGADDVRDVILMIQRLGAETAPIPAAPTTTRTRAPAPEAQIVICPLCGKECKGTRGLAHHMRHKHKAVEAPAEGETPEDAKSEGHTPEDV